MKANSIFGGPVFAASLAFPLALAWFALSPTVRAVSPPPDGGYPNENTAEGDNALFGLTTGFGNTAIGFETLYSNTTGDYNVANGRHALFSNTTGVGNTATGASVLFSNTTGGENTANGDAALAFNTTGVGNTATGAFALYSNTTGDLNTAIGEEALSGNTTGSFNTANGVAALLRNTTGHDNTANGKSALEFNTTGYENTANGVAALASNTTGYDNTANGLAALNSNATGSYNTVNGAYALLFNTTGSSNTATGYGALGKNSSGSNNIALGNQAGFNLTTGDGNIDIGNRGVAGESKTIRIGKQGTQTAIFVAGISGATVAGGVGVIVDTNGHLGTIVSSARFKDGIKPMDKVSEAILSLQPVTFRYKHELDPEGIPQFGLVAEQVEKVSPDLVARDEQGKAYTVRYEAVNAMLLNEFLKEHRKGQEQDATIGQLKSALARQQKEISALSARLEAQASQIQEVNDEFEQGKTALSLVVSNR